MRATPSTDAAENWNRWQVCPTPTPAVAEPRTKLRIASWPYRLLNWWGRVTSGCHHPQFTWPFRLHFVPAESEKRYDSYQVCLTCGGERFYDSKTMQHGPEFVRVSQPRSLWVRRITF